jgi:tetratricopeptide (TPR) repeat protein
MSDNGISAAELQLELEYAMALVKSEEYTEAQDVLRKLIKEAPPDSHEAFDAHDMLEKLEVLIEFDQHKDADIFGGVHEMRLNNLELELEYASALLRAEKYTEAEGVLKKITTENPPETPEVLDAVNMLGKLNLLLDFAHIQDDELFDDFDDEDSSDPPASVEPAESQAEGTLLQKVLQRKKIQLREISEEDLPSDKPLLWDFKQIDKSAVCDLLKHLLALTEYIPQEAKERFAESEERVFLLQLIDNMEKA